MSPLSSRFVLFALLGGLSLVGAQTARTITFVNKCTSDVWLSPTSGAAGTCAAGCPATSTCAGNGYCYYNNPTPSSGNFRVVKGGTNTITYPWADNGIDTVWNGNFAFCQSGTTCQQTASVCDSQGCSASGPFVLAEFNLAKTAVDFYDISIISGVTVPISITPETVDSTNIQSGNPYACGNPGSPTAGTANLGTASWSMSPPSIDYQWVTPPSSSPTTCSSSSSCPSGQTCGLIYSAGNFETVCGYLSGYWSAGSVCGTESSTSYFGCSSTLVNGPYTGTNSAFYGCGDTSGSCYSQGADAYCCGCANWQNVLGTNDVPASTAQCVNNNPTWTSVVLPTLQWLKAACPNCYTYPYDDMSSTFTCTKEVNNYNTQNYTITLCPNGVSWGGTGGSTGTPTSTSTSSSPTGTAGTCSGTSYSSSQVCDSGHICPSGQYYCNGSCYSPSTSCCSSNAIISNSGTCSCNGQGFAGSSYVCDAGALCPAGTYTCGGACYSPASYGCCNGALTAAGKGC